MIDVQNVKTKKFDCKIARKVNVTLSINIADLVVILNSLVFTKILVEDDIIEFPVCEECFDQVEDLIEYLQIRQVELEEKDK
jgi:hypothetical protein